jgi:rhodanese-related sulfurtransferase
MGRQQQQRGGLWHRLVKRYTAACTFLTGQLPATFAFQYLYMKKMIIPAIVFAIAITAFYAFAPQNNIQYVCTPCGYDCDTAVYDKPGTCAHCHMALVDKKTIRFKNITQQQMCARLNDSGVVALDVRTEEEFNGRAAEKFGRIKNALNIPVQQLAARINELAPYKNKQIILYCSHSHRSPVAAYLLSNKGFKVVNMAGGMSTWKNTPGCGKWLVPQQ